MAHKTNACRRLDKLAIPYQLHEYDYSEEHLDAVHAAKENHIPVERLFKTLVAKGDKTGVTVACIPADQTIDLKNLAKISHNKKIEMLPLKELEKTTGYIRGGCSPIGMKKQFPTYLDQAAESQETIYISAGKRGLQLEIKPADLAKACPLTVSELT